jgi:magnesium and cobalt exporter, CNNM family
MWDAKAACYRLELLTSMPRRLAADGSSMEILLILLIVLIMLNGIFAMSEIAVVSSRGARLQNMADNKRPGAAAALVLHNEPSSFLSTIQVGITTVGILNGAIGETVLAEPLAEWLAEYPLLAPHSTKLAFALVVVAVTYLTVVIGELVPKRLALLAPEGIAAFLAKPMTWLARIAKPLVWLLSASSEAVLRLLRAKRSLEPPITDEEIKVLMAQGAEAGVFHESEQQIVSNVLRLDEQRVVSIMTPRTDIYYIDLNDTEDEVRQKIAESPHPRIVVCRGGLNDIVGVLHTDDLLKRVLRSEPLRVQDALRAPLYVPETISITQLLEQFRTAPVHFAFIVDEYGDVEGLVTLEDVLAAIVGELPAETPRENAEAVQREDGSWLIDGSISVERFKTLLQLDELPGEEEGRFNTIAGFVLHHLGRIPAVGDHFESAGLRFEVVDMDRRRVDKLLVSASMRNQPPLISSETSSNNRY